MPPDLDNDELYVNERKYTSGIKGKKIRLRDNCCFFFLKKANKKQAVSLVQQKHMKIICETTGPLFICTIHAN